jgi:hypothetical protein
MQIGRPVVEARTMSHALGKRTIGTTTRGDLLACDICINTAGSALMLTVEGDVMSERVTFERIVLDDAAWEGVLRYVRDTEATV